MDPGRLRDHAATGCQHRSCRHAPAGARRTRAGPGLGGRAGRAGRRRRDHHPPPRRPPAHPGPRPAACFARPSRSASTWSWPSSRRSSRWPWKSRPDQVTFVPERREELTTEGGLDVVGQRDASGRGRWRDAATRGSRLRCSSIPIPKQVEAAVELGAAAVELHTGRYAEPPKGPNDPRARRARERGRRDRRRRPGAARRARPQLPERRADRPIEPHGRAEHRAQHRQPRRLRRA